MEVELKSVNPVVFGGDFCHSSKKDCGYLDRYMRRCWLFKATVFFKDNLSYYEKCYECKKHYQQLNQ